MEQGGAGDAERQKVAELLGRAGAGKEKSCARARGLEAMEEGCCPAEAVLSCCRIASTITQALACHRHKRADFTNRHYAAATQASGSSRAGRQSRRGWRRRGRAMNFGWAGRLRSLRGGWRLLRKPSKLRPRRRSGGKRPVRRWTGRSSARSWLRCTPPHNAEAPPRASAQPAQQSSQRSTLHIAVRACNFLGPRRHI